MEKSMIIILLAIVLIAISLIIFVIKFNTFTCLSFNRPQRNEKKIEEKENSEEYIDKDVVSNESKSSHANSINKLNAFFKKKSTIISIIAIAIVIYIIVAIIIGGAGPEETGGIPTVRWYIGMGMLILLLFAPWIFLIVYANTLKYRIRVFSGETLIATYYYKKNEPIAKIDVPTVGEFKVEGLYLDSDFYTPFTYTIMPKQYLKVYVKWQKIE